MIIHVKVQEDWYRRDHMSGHTKQHKFNKLYRSEYRTDPQRFQFPKNFIKEQIGDKDMHINMIFKGIRLRVVHTKPILF